MPRRRRFRQFPKGHRAGAALVCAVTAAALLAAGLPGVGEGEAAAEVWLDAKVREQVRLDAIVAIDTGDDGEDRDLVREVLAAKRESSPGGSKAPLRRIDFKHMALMAAKRAGIKDPSLFVRQMAAESGLQPCATSGAGAIGIAQIMPATARGWKVDPWIPQDALAAAARAMAKYERQLGSYKLALAAYNAGTGAVQQYGGVPPYAETREYIRRVTTRSYRLPGLTSTFEVPQRMADGFERDLRRLQNDVNRHGGRLIVEEGWRSYEDSMRIWRATKKERGGWTKAKAWAAPPGCSNHVRGKAADLKGSLKLAHRLAPKYGLVFPMPHEPWHVERVGLKTQSGSY